MNDNERELIEKLMSNPITGGDDSGKEQETKELEMEIKTSKKNKGSKNTDDAKTYGSESPWYVKDIEVKIEKMYDDVILPQYAHEGDACADVRAYRIEKVWNENGVEVMSDCDFDSIKLYQGWTALFGTGFKIKIPRGWAINIEGRSGFSIKECVTVPNAPAKIDCPYTGEYRLVMVKINKKPTIVHKNDRIAQMEIVPQYRMVFKEDKVLPDVDNQRKETGLGDSGLK